MVSADVPRRARGMRLLRVLRAAQLTPRMRRLTLGGPELDGAPEGPNIKLLTPPPGVKQVHFPVLDENRRLVWPDAALRPAVRTYSVRRLDRQAGELDVDILLHHAGGMASDWAARAKPGDEVGLGGPGGRLTRPATYYLFAGDHCALPAIAWQLEQLPDAAVGEAFIQVPEPAERQPLRKPHGVRITWIDGPDEAGAGSGLSALARLVAAHPMPLAAEAFVWVGAESDTVRYLRSHMRDVVGVPRTHLLAVGYWKRGLAEDAYHDAHDNDRDTDYHAVWHAERHRKPAPEVPVSSGAGR